MGNAVLSKSKAYIGPIVVLVILWLVLFLTADSLKYWQAWIHWTMFSTITLFITAYFFKRSPELLVRRWQYKDQESAERVAIRKVKFC